MMSELPEIAVLKLDGTTPEIWRVEQINSDGDGGIDMADFSGPNAEARARAFARSILSGDLFPV